MLPVEAFPLLLPAVLVVIGGLLSLAAEAFLSKAGKHAILPWLAAPFLVLAGVAQMTLAPTGHLHGMFAMDPARSWLGLAIITSTLIGIAGLQQSLTRDKFSGGEPYSLACFAGTGALLMVMASDAIGLFMGLELASLSVYALVGLRRNRAESNEGLYKYFVMGAVFSAIFLYGAALTYGATGSTGFGAAILEGREGLHGLGLVLMVIGLLFKVGAVPFHFWSPDAYTGAPVVVTGLMAAIIKVGGFAALGSIWLGAVAALSGSPVVAPLGLDAAVTLGADGAASLHRLNLVLLVVALLSVVVGNFSALRQSSVRRLIAFSSVAHAGYVLLAFTLPAVGETVQLTSMCYYLVGYALATAGALTAIAALSGRDDTGDNLDGLAGQGRAHPFFGLVATVFLVSIAGIPPTVGFLGKYLIFAELVGKGKVAIAGFGMLMAVVGAAYYLRLIISLWAGSRAEERRVRLHPLAGWTLAAAALAIVALLGAAGAITARAEAAPTAVAAAP